MEQPIIKTVEATKQGRFWAVSVDGELLALVLYKKGAMAVRDLLVRLAGTAVTEPTRQGKSSIKKARDRCQPRPAASHGEIGANAPSH